MDSFQTLVAVRPKLVSYLLAGTYAVSAIGCGVIAAIIHRGTPATSSLEKWVGRAVFGPSVGFLVGGTLKIFRNSNTRIAK